MSVRFIVWIRTVMHENTALSTVRVYRYLGQKRSPGSTSSSSLIYLREQVNVHGHQHKNVLIICNSIIITRLKQNLSPGSTSSSSLMVEVSRLTPVVAGVCDSTPRSLFSSESWGAERAERARCY